jgi:amino acid adenylation domain-containing protein
MSSPQPAAFERFERSAIEQSVADRFAERAALHPDRLAVKSLHDSLTYGELNRTANRIARAIIAKLGTQSEPVVLLFGHGAPLVCAILGALKARKFYVPLDPGFPPTRNRSILAASSTKLIVSDDRHRAIAEQLAGPDCDVLSVDSLDDASSPDVKLQIRPDDYAYVLYTSGSTGKPKGVVHTQRSVLHCAMAYVNSAQISPEDRFTLLSRYNFAASVSPLFGALLSGAALFPFDVREHGLTELAQWLSRERITIYHSVPTLFRHFVTALKAEPGLENLRLIKLGGETVFKSDVELYQRHFPDGCRLLASYGSTELNAIRQFFIDKHTTIAGDVVPVGYAVEDTEIVVIDDKGNPIVEGVGEITIRSRYLASGYWQDPELTAAAFSQDLNDPEVRTYRTGDLGSVQADGCLLHLGRKDHQVKIRGHRVETAEVEAALVGIEGVREAAVVVQEEANSDRSLTAYLVLDPPRSRTVQDVRGALEDKLPGYMIPGAFVISEALPMTANGKIDRAALQPPDRAATQAQRPYVKPANPLQYQLVRIWEDLLGISPIGVTEHFVDLGGNSLLAARLLDAVERECGKRLSMAALARAATIEELAVALVKEHGHTVGSPLVEVQPGASGRPFFFLHGDFDGGGFYCRNLAKRLGEEQTVYVFSPHGLDANGALPTFESMASDNVRAIRAIQPSGPYLLGGYCNGGLVAYEMACQLEKAGERVDVLVVIGTRCPNANVVALRRIAGGVDLPKRLARLFSRVSTMAKLPAEEKLRRLSAKFRRGLRGNSEGLVRTRSASMFEIYSASMRRFTPRPYGGRVTAVWGADERKEPPDEVARDWRKAARAVDFHIVPGDHQGCVTNHVAVVGDLIAQRLRNARRSVGAYA